MKFAQYLEEAQIPEWKKAYIDYRRLKKCITRIKKSQPSGILSTPPAVSPATLRSRASHTSRPSKDKTTLSPGKQRMSERLDNGQHSRYGTQLETPPLAQRREPSPPPLNLPPPMSALHESQRSSSQQDPSTQSPYSLPSLQQPSNPSKSPPSKPTRGFSIASLRRQSSQRRGGSSLVPPTLSEILLSLAPTEQQFFTALDEELDKVEQFYISREQDSIVRSSVLKEQLKELQDHQRLFHQNEPQVAKRWPFIPNIELHIKNLGRPQQNPQLQSPAPKHLTAGTREASRSTSVDPDVPTRRLDPDEYHHAKKKLKQAVLEHYRGLELLNNYRILNYTGFRKALKKFDKVTNLLAQDPYMNERVERCTFARDTRIMELLKEMEGLYAQRFENNNIKKARSRLRALTMEQRTHHSTSFRAGAYIGLAIPALAQGIYFSFQPEVRRAIPAWNALLQVYGALIVPCIFSILITTNLLVWTSARINYVFIFELDVRTAIDPRSFAAIPSFLFLTLSYAFWLSFNPLGSGLIKPTTWPLIWLIFAIVFVCQPLPIAHPHSRRWLVKKIGKLATPGWGRVEFTDFWLGDQLCSLTFTLSSLWTLGCAYRESWAPDTYAECGLSNAWGVPCALSCLPSFIRFLQCIKRWLDTGLETHLLNGGKYMSSIFYYVAYYIWRHHDAKLGGWSFALFCVFGTIMSLCTSAWDLLMDWSLLSRDAPYPLLKKELVYNNHVPLYYVAMITNVFVRFIWVWFFLFRSRGLNITIRSFIFGCLEVLRRVQWNFYRLENEHLGNTDQYRVTRDIPLPYTFRDDADDDDVYDPNRKEEEEEEDGVGPRRRRFLRGVHLAPIEHRSSEDNV